MANFQIDWSQIRVETTKAESRKPITSAHVQRPTREIRAQMQSQIKESLRNVIFESLLAMYGKPVYAKGANWLVDHANCAHALRVAYNTHLAESGEKLTTQGAREVWSQIYGKAFPDDDAPVFSDSDNSDSDNDD